MADTRQSDPARSLLSIAVQLERDRRAFLMGAAGYVAGNLVLVGLVWWRAGLGPTGWILPAIAFLVNVFFVILADWELRWEAVWRREAPRLERELGRGGEVLSPLLAEISGPRTLQRWMKWTAWVIAGAWLAALLLSIRAAGLHFGLSG
ncbi:MAG: hypothetical protein R3326_01150 [Gemmatimonadota bacterium]|nr:hypothetical protein [Gemmatimonadota bacterium]